MCSYKVIRAFLGQTKISSYLANIYRL